MTDYPDNALLDNLTHNVERNFPASKRKRARVEVFVEGYTWGSPVDRLLELVVPGKYDLVILSDLVFNHSQVREFVRFVSKKWNISMSDIDIYFV